MTVARQLESVIAETGPIGLDAFMAACLRHYYATRDPLGARGDFVTAPEVSQMFGELIGLWAAQVWADQGAPSRFVLAELGPGRGTLMADALRATAGVPGFAEAAEVWLVEMSPALRERQAEALAGRRVRWVEAVEALPPGPAIIIANEFFDALPVRQVQRTGEFWRERLVTRGQDGALALVWGAARPDPGAAARFPLLPDGAVAEIAPAGEAVAAALGARIAAEGGAALIIDYGAWDGSGDTLQALAGHVPVDPLAAPGEADLTTHVRFRALAEAAGPVRASAAIGQGEFLERLGIAVRALRLARDRDAETVAAIAAAHRRLTHPDEMGNLFRVMAFTPDGAPLPPGFA